MGTCPPGNVVKCFCALVVTAKRSVDELFMHSFHNLFSASGAKPLDPTRTLYLDPAGDFHRHVGPTPNLPTPEKNLKGAHA